MLLLVVTSCTKTIDCHSRYFNNQYNTSYLIVIVCHVTQNLCPTFQLNLSCLYKQRFRNTVRTFPSSYPWQKKQILKILPTSFQSWYWTNSDNIKHVRSLKVLIWAYEAFKYSTCLSQHLNTALGKERQDIQSILGLQRFAQNTL